MMSFWVLGATSSLADLLMSSNVFLVQLCSPILHLLTMQAAAVPKTSFLDPQSSLARMSLSVHKKWLNTQLNTALRKAIMSELQTKSSKESSGKPSKNWLGRILSDLSTISVTGHGSKFLIKRPVAST